MRLSQCSDIADLRQMADDIRGKEPKFWFIENGKVYSIWQMNVRFVVNMEAGVFEWYAVEDEDDPDLGAWHDSELFSNRKEAFEALKETKDAS